MNNEAIKKIAEINGFDEASRQLFEEVGELIVAVNKYHRALELYDIEYESAFLDIRKYDIAEEIADTIIMIEQIKHLLTISDENVEQIIDQKLNRQLERINNGLE